MIIQILHCPHCHGTDIVRHGQTRQGKQRYRCREQPCAGRTFLLDYSYPGQSPEVKQQIVDMAMNARGIRDTARVLHISTNTVMTELKKGTYPPPRQPCSLPGRESRAHYRGDVPFRSTGSPAWTHVRVGRNVEVRAPQSAPTVALARDRSSQWYGARIRLWETARYGFFAA